MQLDPISALEHIRKLPQYNISIRDAIFIENLQEFLLYSCEHNKDKQEFMEANLDAFVKIIAEVSSNKEAGYLGNKDKLVEYAKRIVKMIDDCGTIQKADYLAC